MNWNVFSVGYNANNSESSEQAMTSDESQEAMRLFAASPPEGMFQHGAHQVSTSTSVLLAFVMPNQQMQYIA